MTGRRAPVDLPEPFADNPIARESLWYEFGAGDDEPRAPAWTWTDEPPMDDHVAPPPPLDGRRTPLPFGTLDLLEGAAYPSDRLSTMDSLANVLVASFGLQWHDPENPYNTHRGYPSPRCLYPVEVFVDDGERWRMLRPERHALVDGDTDHSGHTERIALIGRYTRIPSGYKWFRGSLIGLELGIALRSLCVGLELFGRNGFLRLPGASSRGLITELGLAPAWEWSLPLVVELGPHTEPPRPAPADVTAPSPALADLLRVNRAQEFKEPVPLGSAIPTNAAPAAMSWAELLWQRNSGRMPRGLRGMSGRRSRLPAGALTDAVRWLTVPPPGGTLSSVADLVMMSVALQGIDGYPDGIYRITDGEPVPHTLDANAAARLEAEYRYSLAPDSGCDIRHASMIWFLSVRPRELFARFGPTGWSAAHYVCGWAVHGLGLAATAAGLFARTVRAFNEIPTQRILGLGPDDMIVLAVVAGTPRHPSGVLLDIRL